MRRGSWARLTGAAVVALLAACKEENRYVPPPPLQVGVATPVRQPVTPYLTTTGNAVAYNQVDLVARVEGFLVAIDYADGAVVKKGDTLLVVEPAPYEARYQQAQGQLAADEAKLAYAESDFRRKSSLRLTDDASQAVLDEARARRDEARANVTSDRAQLEQAAINLGYTRITAPFDGLVTAHLVSTGQLVGAGGPTRLASIVQFDPIYVSFTVSDQEVARIRAGRDWRPLTVSDSGRIPVEVGTVGQEGYPLRGTIDYADPQIDQSTGTLMVRGVLRNPDRVLLPGAFVRVRVPISQPHDALLVPDRVIGADQGGRYVLVVDKDDTVAQRRVVPGAQYGALRVIESGLAADDRVIVTGLQQVVRGALVVPQPAPVADAK